MATRTRMTAAARVARSTAIGWIVGPPHYHLSESVETVTVEGRHMRIEPPPGLAEARLRSI
jgi:hypothetical protein